MSKIISIWEKPSIWSLEKQKQILLFDKIPFATRNESLIGTFQVLGFIYVQTFLFFGVFVLLCLGGKMFVFVSGVVFFLLGLFSFVIKISTMWN